jgi:hypothetical protein
LGTSGAPAHLVEPSSQVLLKTQVFALHGHGDEPGLVQFRCYAFRRPEIL